MEARAHDTGVKLQRELDHAALSHAINLFVQDEKQSGFAVGRVQELAVQRAPGIARRPYLAATGIVDLHRNPTERGICLSGNRRSACVRDVPVEAPALD